MEFRLPLSGCIGNADFKPLQSEVSCWVGHHPQDSDNAKTGWGSALCFVSNLGYFYHNIKPTKAPDSAPRVPILSASIQFWIVLGFNRRRTLERKLLAAVRALLFIFSATASCSSEKLGISSSTPTKSIINRQG